MSFADDAYFFLALPDCKTHLAPSKEAGLFAQLASKVKAGDEITLPSIAIAIF